MSEPQPISTAPKDGTRIFIFSHGWVHAPVARWIEYPGNPVQNDEGKDVDMFGWEIDEMFCIGDEEGWLGWADDPKPEFWMPLPNPTSPMEQGA